jgi:hypothetical protein
MANKNADKNQESEVKANEQTSNESGSSVETTENQESSESTSGEEAESSENNDTDSTDKSESSKEGSDAPATESNIATKADEEYEKSEEYLNLKKEASMYFISNKVKEIFLTTDGCGFYHRPDAVSHALTLEDKRVVPFKRDDL